MKLFSEIFKLYKNDNVIDLSIKLTDTAVLSFKINDVDLIHLTSANEHDPIKEVEVNNNLKFLFHYKKKFQCVRITVFLDYIAYNFRISFKDYASLKEGINNL
jgi:hypothetical protein